MADVTTDDVSGFDVPPPLNNLEVIAKIKKAQAMVAALCKDRREAGARSWVMSIPARPDHDPDLVIADALHAAEQLIGVYRPDAQRDALAAKLAEADKEWSAMMGTAHAECVKTHNRANAAIARAYAAEQRAAALAEALEHLVSVINAAGLMNLSRGVQLGQTVWFCKATAAIEHAATALAGNAVPTGDTREAVARRAEAEEQAKPGWTDRSVGIAIDKAVAEHRATPPAAPVVTEVTVEAVCDAVVAQGPADVTWPDRNYLRWMVRTVAAAFAATQQAGTSQDRQISPAPTAAAVNPPGGERRDG